VVKAGKEKHDQIKIYIIGALMVVFCLVGYFRFFHNRPAPGPAPTGSAGAMPSSPAVPQVSVQPAQPGGAQEAARAEPASLVVRDIFEPGQAIRMADAKASAAEKASAPDVPLLLTGLIAGEKNPIAIINGQFQRVGDRIGTLTILRIGTNEVLLKGEDREITLRFVDHGKN
jgi:hypothetical protein